MMRKLLIVVLCGFVQRFECSRVKFDPEYNGIMYRHDLHAEPVYKREHFFPREALAPTGQMLPPQSLIRNEPMFANEPMMAQLPQQAVLANDEYLPNEQIIPGDIRAEPILRREPFIRREPMLRREPFIRGEPVLRAPRIYQNAQMFRDGGVFRNEPSNSYTFMVSQCPCQEAQSVGQSAPHEGFFQIQQPIQPLQPAAIPMQQPIMPHRLCFPKTILKPQAYQPILAFPRLQRYVRKGCKSIAENIPFPPQAVMNSPIQDFNSIANEPVAFSGNFQSQPQQQESTSEAAQNNPVTVRTATNPLALAQMSSIC